MTVDCCKRPWSANISKCEEQGKGYINDCQIAGFGERPYIYAIFDIRHLWITSAVLNSKPPNLLSY